MSTISKERFLEVYNKHLSNKWTKFAFRYFSTNTLDKDRWLSKTFVGIEISLFVIAFAFNLLGMSHTTVGILTFTFLGLLVAIAILKFGALFMNNFRIRKIIKELNISKDEYETCILMYL